MKHLSLILNIVLLAAVAVLYVLHFNDKGAKTEQIQEIVDRGNLEVAYVNSDSLLEKYLFVKDLSDQLEKTRTKLEGEYENRARGLQNEVENFQRTAGNMTINQARAIEEDLVKKQQNLARYQEQLSQQLMQEQAKVQDSIYQRVSTFLNDYGRKNNLQLVLTYQRGSGVLFAHDSLNITNDIINGLNQAYEKNNKGGEK